MPKVSLTTSFTPELVALLHALGRKAMDAGATLWLVGGPVRDALLGIPALDIDLVSEAPANDLANAMGVPARAKTRFGTLKLQVDGQTIDLATARAERYAKHGALPGVRPSDIETDLRRRDFTLNAMAVNLSPSAFGALLDPLGGARDLDQGLLRGLHAATFRDDATRMLRLTRYATRLRFRIHPATRRWLQESLPAMSSISSARIHRELTRTIEEPQGVRALHLAHRLGVLGAIHPAMGADRVADALRAAARNEGSSPALLLSLTVGGDANSVIERIGLTRHERALMAHANRLLNDSRISRPGLPPSEIAALVDGAPIDAVRAAMALLTGQERRNLRRHLATSHRRPHLSGRDLLRLGIPPGASVGRAMSALQNACLDGKINTRIGEVRLINRLVREEKQEKRS